MNQKDEEFYNSLSFKEIYLLYVYRTDPKKRKVIDEIFKDALDEEEHPSEDK